MKDDDFSERWIQKKVYRKIKIKDSFCIVNDQIYQLFIAIILFLCPWLMRYFENSGHAIHFHLMTHTLAQEPGSGNSYMWSLSPSDFTRQPDFVKIGQISFK